VSSLDAFKLSPQSGKIQIASVTLFRLIVGTFFRQQMHVTVTGNNADSHELVELANYCRARQTDVMRELSASGADIIEARRNTANDPNRASSCRIGYLIGYDTAKGLGAGCMNETGHLLAGSAALLTMPRIVRVQTTKPTKRSVTPVWVENIGVRSVQSGPGQEACSFFD